MLTFDFASAVIQAYWRILCTNFPGPGATFTGGVHSVGTKFPEGSVLAANNYCRNPNELQAGPWCMVELERQGALDCVSCVIPICGGEDVGGGEGHTNSEKFHLYWFFLVNAANLYMYRSAPNFTESCRILRYIKKLLNFAGALHKIFPPVENCIGLRIWEKKLIQALK